MKEQNRKHITDLQTTQALAEVIGKYFSLSEVLYLNISPFRLLNGIDKHFITHVLIPSGIQEIYGGDRNINRIFNEFDSIEEKFDYIIGDLPFGLETVEWVDATKNVRIKDRMNWILLLKSLFLLKNGGYGLYTVEPAFWTAQGSHLTKELGAKGFFVHAIFNPPENILAPITSLRPNIILISREKRDYIFIAELTSIDEITALLENYRNKKGTDYFEEGIFIEHHDFKGINNYTINKQIERLISQYKEYHEYKVKNISKEIILGNEKEDFEDRFNSIYIPRRGKTPILCNYKNSNIKHSNYFQVVLDESIVKNVYVELFFSSDLGKLVLQSTYGELAIPHITKQDLEEISIPIPELSEQETIIQTKNRLDTLQAAIIEFEKELSLSPKSAYAVQSKIEGMLDDLNVLSDAGRIRAIIRKGESKIIEFKQTLSLDIRTKTKEKYIEKSTLKEIIAFLNTEGGTLLIGVTYDGYIEGIQEEIAKFYKNTDKFLLHFKNLLKEKIGEKFGMVQS